MTFPDAVIFASGAATRAASYANGRSKCLLPLPDGELVLDKIMQWLLAAGVRRVTLLTTYDAHGIEVQEYAATAFLRRGLEVRFVGEPALGGTVSALRAYVRAFPVGERTLLLNHDTVLTKPFLSDFVSAFSRLNAQAMDARAIASGFSSGVRLLSRVALHRLADSRVHNVEDALSNVLVYPVPDDAFIDVGTLEGYDNAQAYINAEVKA